MGRKRGREERTEENIKEKIKGEDREREENEERWKILVIRMSCNEEKRERMTIKQVKVQ